MLQCGCWSRFSRSSSGIASLPWCPSMLVVTSCAEQLAFISTHKWPLFIEAPGNQCFTGFTHPESSTSCLWRHWPSGNDLGDGKEQAESEYQLVSAFTAKINAIPERVLVSQQPRFDCGGSQTGLWRPFCSGDTCPSPREAGPLISWGRGRSFQQVERPGARTTQTC